MLTRELTRSAGATVPFKRNLGKIVWLRHGSGPALDPSPRFPVDARERELPDVDPQWQLRQKRLLLARDRRIRGDRPARDVHLIDVELALQQRQPPPDDADAIDGQPDAVPTGDLEVADRRVGREGAVDATDRNLSCRRRERPREHVRQYAFFLSAFVGSLPFSGGDEKPESEKGQEGCGERQRAGRGEAEAGHQNGCPMLT